MELVKIEKPSIENINMDKTLRYYSKNREKVEPYLDKANQPKYLYWSKLKYKSSPNGLSKEEYWSLVKMRRSFSSKTLSIKSEEGKYFKWFRLPYTEEFLHKVDISTGGRVFTSYEALSVENKQKYISRGIIEEAIASSQIEGAHTSRRAAKKLILEKKKPKNNSERMIINNYKTMQLIDEEYKNNELSLDLLYEIHANITNETVSKNEQFRLRKNEDEIVVHDGSVIAHIPPGEKFVKKEINNLIKYCNDEDSDKFTHPLIKAIFIHFWIGYLHPFTDGNGRLARALFYWYLLKKGYWAIMYLPISSVIKKSRSQYERAYLYSEQDDFDITYFYDYNIKKIEQALKEFEDYLEKTVKENKKVDEFIMSGFELNSRQKQLIYYLTESDGNKSVTITSHSIINNISRQTASKELKKLESMGLLVSKKRGKFKEFYASNKFK